MKPLHLLLVVALISSLFFGCAQNNAPEPAPSPPPAEQSPAVPDGVAEPAPSAGDVLTKRVGGDNYGFWDIPQDWVNFVEANPEHGDDMIQFSDLSGSIIITARYFADTDATPEQYLTAFAGSMEQYGVLDIQGIQSQLGDGLEVLQVFMILADDTAILATSFSTAVDGGDEIVRLIIVEGPVGDEFVDTAMLFEETYSVYE